MKLEIKIIGDWLWIMKKNKKRILVVLGGTSKERDVSLASGRACSKALKLAGYKVMEFDPKKTPFSSIDKSKIDIIFNALHGKDGEDGLAQNYFEYFKIPYTHSGVISSINAMNKAISKKIFINKKILIVKIILVSILTITAVVSLPFLVSSGYTHFKHALDWNYFIGVVLFYLLSFLFRITEQA